MIRVQAYIVDKVGDTYYVETLTEGYDNPCKFSILAKSEDEAAMTAIRKAEEMDEMLQKAMRVS